MLYCVDGNMYESYEEAQKAEAELLAWRKTYMENRSVFCVTSKEDMRFFVVFGDTLEKRREMMSAFGRYIIGDQFIVKCGTMNYEKRYDVAEMPFDEAGAAEVDEFIKKHGILDKEPEYGITEVGGAYVLNAFGRKPDKEMPGMELRMCRFVTGRY